MKKRSALLLLMAFIHINVYAQSKILTISNAANFNITLGTPHQPIDPSFDANLNIGTLLTSLLLGDTEVNDGIFFDYEIAVQDDVQYYSPFHLTITSNNNILAYANLTNDTTGNINLFASDRIIIGTGLGWLPLYAIPVPVHPPIMERQVEVGSLMGATSLDAGINACIVSPNLPGSTTQTGRPLPTASASISVFAGNHILVHGGGLMSPAVIGFGNNALFGDIDCPISLTCEEGNLHLVGGDDFAHARIGNQNTGSHSISGQITALVNSVPVNLPFNGNVFIEGGTGFISEAQFGHDHQSNADNAAITAPIFIDADGSVDLKSGSGTHARARIGHSLQADNLINLNGPVSVRSGQNTILNSRFKLTGDSAFTQIGHWSDAINGFVTDSIYLEVGEYDGKVSLLGGDTTGKYTLVGHSCQGGNLNLIGNIDLLVQTRVELHSGSADLCFANIGHRQVDSTSSISDGDIDIRNGKDLLVSSSRSTAANSPARIGHHSDTYDGRIDIVSGTDITLQADTNVISSVSAEIRGFDTISIKSGDSIHLKAHSGEAKIRTDGTEAFLSIDAIRVVLATTSTGVEASFNQPNGHGLIIRAGESIEIMQSDMTLNDAQAGIYLESDSDYLIGSLWTPLVFNGIGGNPLAGTILALDSPHESSDDQGVIRFNNLNNPCSLSTVNGDISILSKAIDATGLQYDLKISDTGSRALNPYSQTGKILIGITFSPPSLFTDVPVSYENTTIKTWNIQTLAEMYLNVNNEINVVDSEIDLKTLLLLTDTPIP